MKKITAVLIALVLLLTVSAFAQGTNWVDLDLTELTVTVPEDIICYIPEVYGNGETFAVFYQDYSDYNLFNKCISFTYYSGVENIHIVSPSRYAENSVDEMAKTAVESGFNVLNSYTIDAGLDEQDGKEALFTSYGISLDYSPLGYNEILDIYTVAMIVPFPERNCTYHIIVSTDNPQESDILFDIADSIRWY